MVINEIINGLNLPPDAEQWLSDMWNVIQLFDDIEDGDPIEHKNGNDVLWSVLVGMPLNPFFRANQDVLTPLVIVQIHKWQAANKAEAEGKADEKSYMWRAGYWDLVLLVCHLCHGRDIDAQGALLLYGEPYADYKKEFNNA